MDFEHSDQEVAAADASSFKVRQVATLPHTVAACAWNQGSTAVATCSPDGSVHVSELARDGTAAASSSFQACAQYHSLMD
eukprot:jgi/Mesen1/2553/ME000162S01676